MNGWSTIIPAGTERRGALGAVGLAVIAVAIFFWPGAAEGLEFSRRGILHGQLWRLFTGHLTHFTSEQLLWDGVVFLVLSVLVAGYGGARWVACILGGALVISLAILGFCPSAAFYRGLSGIDSALFTAAAILMLRQSMDNRRPLFAVVAVAALLAFLGKTVYELGTGRSVFAQELGDGVLPLALSHVAGAGWGILIAFWPSEQTGTNRPGPVSPPASADVR